MMNKPTYEELEQKIEELERTAELVTSNEMLKQEVDERKQDEESLREYSEQLQKLSEASFDGVVIMEKGVIQEANQTFADLFGYELSEIIGIDALDFIAPESKDIVFNNIMSGYENRYEATVQKKDGEKFEVEACGAAITYKGRPARITAMRDITKRKQAEETLRESEDRLVAFMDSATDGFVLFDSDLNYVKMNKAAQEITGVGRKEFAGKNVLDVIPDFKETGRYNLYKKVMKTGVSLITPDLLPHPKFGKKRLDLKVFKAGDGLGVIFTDITERKLAEEALKKVHDELEQRVEERTKELKIKTKSLEELNTAMKVLLDKRKEDRVLLEDSVLANVKKLIEPLFDKMRETELDDLQKTILSIIESNLYEVTSPITRKLSMKHLNLTPTEMKIANLIRHGTTTKKIAKLMNSSPRTIDTHRKNIRGKIGLNKKGGNLRSYLLSLNR